MFQTLKKAWGVPEIRKKILYTLLMIVIFRFGSAVTVPFLDPDIVKSWMAEKTANGGFLDYLNTLTGGALSKATVFSLSGRALSSEGSAGCPAPSARLLSAPCDS